MRKTQRPQERSAPPAAVLPASVIARVVAILGLFHSGRLAISAADIAAALAISSASAYRYANELLAAGLLAKGGGRFRLGPKIIELEYLIRSFDPVVRAGEPLLRELAAKAGHDALLCSVYGETVVNVLHVTGRRPVALTYTKGLPMPLFRGAQARVILAYTEYRKLKRLFEKSMDDASLRRDVRAIGRDWGAFSTALRGVRAEGHCIAHGELDRGLTGIAAPVLARDGDVTGSVGVVLAGKPEARKRDALVRSVMDTAAVLSRHIARVGDGPRAVDARREHRLSSRPRGGAPT